MTLTVKIDREKNWCYFYISYLIFSSYSVYMFLNPKIATSVQLGILVLSVLSMLRFNKSRIKKNMLAIPVVIIGIFVAASILTTVDTVATILVGLRFLMILYCVVIFQQRDIDLLEIIYQVLFVLMFFYFCCYVVFDVFFPSLGLSYIRVPLVNQNGISTFAVYESHFYFYFRWATNSLIFGIPIKRLCGFCWEPGMYQLYLNYILMYLLFFDKTQRRNWKRIVFTVINIALCTSAMGFLVAVALFTVALMLQKNKVLRIICTIPLLVIGIMAIQSILVTKSVESAYSYSHRMSELSLLYDVLFKNHILGSAVIKSNGSNGLIRFLWSYGYLAVAVVIFLSICLVRNKKRIWRKQQKIIFAIWLVLALVNEPIEFFNFTFLIAAFLIVDTAKLRTNKKLAT